MPQQCHHTVFATWPEKKNCKMAVIWGNSELLLHGRCARHPLNRSSALMKHEGVKCKFLQVCWWTSILMCKVQEMVYWGPCSNAPFDSDLCIPLGISLPGRDAEKNSSLKPELLCVPTDHGGCAPRSWCSHEPSPGPSAVQPWQHGQQGGGRSGWWSGGPLTMILYQMQSWLYYQLIYSILIRGAQINHMPLPHSFLVITKKFLFPACKRLYKQQY